MAITKVEDSQVKIRNVDFTQSVFWARLANDCIAKIALDIPDGKLYTIKALYKDASVEIPAPKTEDTTTTKGIIKVPAIILGVNK